MAIFVDTFTEAADTTLASHTPDTGTSWSLVWQDGANPTLTVNAANDDLRGMTVANSGVMYSANGTYPTANYDGVFTLKAIAAFSTSPFYVFVRFQDQENMYAVRLSNTASDCQLYKKVSGTWTALGSAFSIPAAGSVCKLEINGSSLKFYDDGVEIASATDSDISAAGKFGFGMGGGAELVNSGDDCRSNWQIDSLTVTDLGGAATIEQEGFRFRNDDGSESSATWKANQDVNIYLSRISPFRLRTLLNTTGDLGSSAFRMEYRRKEQLLFSDALSDNSWDTTKWEKAAYKDTNASVTVVETGGVLEITPLTSTAGRNYNGYMSLNRFNFTNCNSSLKVTQPANNESVNDFLIVLDSLNVIGFDIEGISPNFTIYFVDVIGGVHTSTSLTWNSTTMAYIRIRHESSDDTIRWDTSPDASAWTQRRSLARPWAITALKFNIASGTYQETASPGVMKSLDFKFNRNIGSWTAVA